MTTNCIASLCPQCLCGENLLLVTRNFFTATNAAAVLFRKMAAASPVAAMILPITPQQRQPPVLPPPRCQFSANVPDTRHILWRKSRKSVALPVFVAIHFGDNFATTGIYYPKTFTRDS